MDAYADRRIGKLSTGMKQKVSIARTMIHDPDVLVLDEATAGLDVIASRTIIDLIRQARDRGKTVLFSTHRMGEVGLLCDDLALVHRGKLLYNGTYDEFAKADAGTLARRRVHPPYRGGRTHENHHHRVSRRK